MLAKIRRAALFAPRDWGALALAAAALLQARIRFALVPTQQIIEELRPRVSMPAQQPLDPVEAARVGHVSWAICVAAGHVPWRSDCLIQVIAADRMLRRYGFNPSFYLGAAKENDGALAAHAWLRCGNIIVNSGSIDRFSVMIGPANG